MNRIMKHDLNRFNLGGARTVYVLTLLITTGALSGCATDVDPLDANFGNSVQRMVEAQTREPVRAEVPLPESFDGKLGEQVYKQYRETTGKPQEVKSSKNLSLDIDSN